MNLINPTVACEGPDAAGGGRCLEAPAEAVEGRLRVQIQGVSEKDVRSAILGIGGLCNIGNRKDGSSTEISRSKKPRLCALQVWNVVPDQK